MQKGYLGQAIGVKLPICIYLLPSGMHNLWTVIHLESKTIHFLHLSYKVLVIVNYQVGFSLRQWSDSSTK